MNYFIQEVTNDDGLVNTAGIKARDDMDAIILDYGYTPIHIFYDQNARKSKNAAQRALLHLEIGKQWHEALKPLQSGDTLLIQGPPVSHSVMIAREIRACRKRGVRIVLLLHDLEILRYVNRKDLPVTARLRHRLEETSLLEECDLVVAHNGRMKRKLMELGVEDEKILKLQIFDYLIPEDERLHSMREDAGLSQPVIVAGTLRPGKAGYVYNLPSSPDFNLYGPAYEENGSANVHYQGSFPPDELPFILKGSFGLVWDGPSANVCTGAYGDYLKVNNPHKTSLYLASGIPVIIWEKAALAGYIRKNHCGITVRSLGEISSAIEQLSEKEYAQIQKNARIISEHMRSGYHTRKILQQIDEILG